MSGMNWMSNCEDEDMAKTMTHGVEALEAKVFNAKIYHGSTGLDRQCEYDEGNDISFTKEVSSREVKGSGPSQMENLYGFDK